MITNNYAFIGGNAAKNKSAMSKVFMMLMFLDEECEEKMTSWWMYVYRTMQKSWLLIQGSFGLLSLIYNFSFLIVKYLIKILMDVVQSSTILIVHKILYQKYIRFCISLPVRPWKYFMDCRLILF